MNAAPYSIRDCRSAAIPALVLASPHSGRAYPVSFLDSLVCDERDVRRAEDAWVDRIAGHAAAQLDLPLISATWGRSYLDLNRAPDELDPRIVEGFGGATLNERVRAGLGVIPRVARPGIELHGAPLSLAQARSRIEEVHQPYHDALRRLIDRAYGANGHAILIDCHSMPPMRRRGRQQAQIILGDRHGRSAAEALVSVLETSLSRHFRVDRNRPYAGGYTTCRYGRPENGIHAVQIEIDRSLYMDMDTLLPNEGMGHVAEALSQAIDAVSMAVETDWRAMRLAAE